MRVTKILTKIGQKYNQYKELKAYQNILEKNSIFTKSKNGKTCFIIGNGPSVADQDLTKLANQETFVMNSFWRHPQYKTINPKYFLGVSLPHDLNSKESLIWNQDFNGANPVISTVPETKLFFSNKAKEFIEANNLFKNNPIHYILQRGFIEKDLNFNMDPTKPFPFTKNTVLLSLLLAVHMGFEKIYLLGCEHDFLAHPSYRAYTDFKHFYAEPASFIPESWQNPRYENAIYGGLKLFQNYRFFKERITRDFPQVEIYNATPESFLDIFPFVKFEDLKL